MLILATLRLILTLIRCVPGHRPPTKALTVVGTLVGRQPLELPLALVMSPIRTFLLEQHRLNLRPLDLILTMHIPLTLGCLNTLILLIPYPVHLSSLNVSPIVVGRVRQGRLALATRYILPGAN